MLLETFLNRYRNHWVAPIRFPSVVVPVLMIIGAVIAFVVTPLVVVMMFMDVLPEVFRPKFALVCMVAGGGLVIACSAIGAIYGQIVEKRSGYTREGYESKMMLYLMILGLSLPFPAFYGFKFFYNYPFARYPSYILEVKPSPELKAEIERFGLAEIKWHTPYDYSLDRQVIRYDFGEPVDGDWRGYFQKNSILREVASQRNRAYADKIRWLSKPDSMNFDEALYPQVFLTESEERKCVIRVPLLDEYDDVSIIYEIDGEKRKLEFLKVSERSKDYAYVDASSVFTYAKQDMAAGYSADKWVCTAYSYNGDYYFIVNNILLTTLNVSVFAYEQRASTYINPGMDQFFMAIRYL